MSPVLSSIFRISVGLVMELGGGVALGADGGDLHDNIISLHFPSHREKLLSESVLKLLLLLEFQLS